jgi:hypothetical protein
VKNHNFSAHDVRFGGERDILFHIRHYEDHSTKSYLKLILLANQSVQEPLYGKGKA